MRLDLRRLNMNYGDEPVKSCDACHQKEGLLNAKSVVVKTLSCSHTICLDCFERAVEDDCTVCSTPLKVCDGCDAKEGFFEQRRVFVEDTARCAHNLCRVCYKRVMKENTKACPSCDRVIAVSDKVRAAISKGEADSYNPNIPIFMVRHIDKKTEDGTVTQTRFNSVTFLSFLRSMEPSLSDVDAEEVMRCLNELLNETEDELIRLLRSEDDGDGKPVKIQAKMHRGCTKIEKGAAYVANVAAHFTEVERRFGEKIRSLSVFNQGRSRPLVGQETLQTLLEKLRECFSKIVGSSKTMHICGLSAQQAAAFSSVSPEAFGSVFLFITTGITNAELKANFLDYCEEMGRITVAEEG